MKKKLLLLSCLITTLFAKTQNVGIGTLTPQTKLHVYNGASGALPFSFSPLAVESNGHTYINILSPAANESAVLFGQPGSSANGSVMYNNTGTPNGFQFRNNGNITRMTIVSSGNVGIGTINPSEKLEVTGNIKADTYLYTTPKSFSHTLSGIDFVPERNTDTTIIGVGSGSITMQTDLPFKRLIAPVHLPAGATMVNMTVYITDNSASDNLQVVLYRKTITSAFFPDNLGFITSSGSGALASYATPVFGNVVNNNVYTYYISVGAQNTIWTGNMYLHAVVIEYTTSSTL
jgi:hypothetical protein